MSDLQNGAQPPVHPLDQNYYVYKDGGTIGPITGLKVKEMIEAGAIIPNTNINIVGEPNWIHIENIPAFAAYFASAPAAPATAPSRRAGIDAAAPFAGFWIRLGAYLIDYICIFVLCFLAGLLIAGFAALSVGPDNMKIFLETHQTAINIVSLAIGIAYNVYFISGKWQATPGKRLCGIHIVRAEGGPMTPLGALARYLAYFLSAVIFGFGFLMIFWSDQRKGLHDILCRTRVVYGNL